MEKQTKPFIWLIIFLVGFPQISETIYTPSLTDLTVKFHVNAGEIQYSLGIYFAGFAIGVFIWGILSDFIGRKSSMLIGIAIYIAGSFLCLLSSDFYFFLFARFIQAAGAAVGSNVSQTILRDIYNDKERIGIFSTISSVLAFSPAIGPLIGSFIASFWNVAMVFRFLIFMGCLAFIGSFTCLKETLDFKTKTKYPIKNIFNNILKDRTFWVYGALIGIINGIIFSYYGEAPFIFMDTFGFSILEYGCIGFIVALASFSGARFCKKRANATSNQSILFTGNSIFFLGAFIFLLASLLPISFKTICLFIVLFSIFMIMFGLACMLPVCLSNSLLYHKNYLGIAGAVLGLYYYSIVSVIIWLTSLFHSSALYTFPALLLLWFLVNSGLIILNKKRQVL